MVCPSPTVLGYQFLYVMWSRRNRPEIDWFPSPLEASQKVDILGFGHQ
jgi:hypothetical protein